uniref:Uncharacterized protein n=1 Tax=Heterorhabditis bacteriophora TaxID=37862 RepID=A0A1I7WQ37_HETBA
MKKFQVSRIFSKSLTSSTMIPRNFNNRTLAFYLSTSNFPRVFSSLLCFTMFIYLFILNLG